MANAQASCCHALPELGLKRHMKRMTAIQLEMANGKSNHPELVLAIRETERREGGDVDGIPVTTHSSSTDLKMGADRDHCISWKGICVDLSSANDKRINTRWQPKTQKRDLPRSSSDPTT